MSRSHSPASVVLVGPVLEIPNELLTLARGIRRLGNMHNDGQPRNEEHRSAVFACKVTIVRLGLAIIFEPVSGAFQGGPRRRQFRSGLIIKDGQSV